MDLITTIASILPIIMFSIIPILWLVDGKKLKELTLHALIASILAWLISTFLKDIFATTRPFLTNGLEIKTLTIPFDHAFPSSHTAAIFALSVTIFFHHRKLGYIFISTSLAVGIARVLANVHYPIDILGGAIIGTIMALSVDHIHLFSLLKKKY